METEWVMTDMNSACSSSFSKGLYEKSIFFNVPPQKFTTTYDTCFSQLEKVFFPHSVVMAMV
jgi:hypothetical protein